MKPDHDLPPVS